MATRAFVPDELQFAPFRGTDARHAGLLTRTQLEGHAWRRLFRDVYVHQAVAVDSRLRVEAARLIGGGHVLAGRTAAWVHGLWTPLPGQVVPIELARPRDASGRRLTGACRSRRVWRTLAGDGDVLDLDGLLVTSALRTCFDLVRGRQLVEAVVVLDAFAHGRAFTIEEFASYAEAHVRWPGVRRAKQASTLADAGAASPGESRCRMVVVLSGFPQPLVQAEVVLPEGRRFLDLLLKDVPRPVGIEFDGAHHDEEARRRGDRRRQNSILVGTQIVLLRYDSYSVAYQRDVMVDELVATSGFTDVRPLIARQFDRGPVASRW